MKLTRPAIDERFLAHRLRSSSAAGMATAAMALLVFQYRLMTSGAWSWDLLSVGATFVIVKLALMVWYIFTD
jgi:hypothetical protein